LVTVEDLLLALRYDDEERPYLETLIPACKAFLQIAGAYDETNPLTKSVMLQIIGFWADNRELNHADFVKIGQFPIGIQSLINSLRFGVMPSEEG